MKRVFIKGATLHKKQLFYAHLGQGMFLWALNFAIIYYMVVKGNPPKKIGFFDETYIKTTSKLKGQMVTFFEIYPLSEVFDLHTQSSPNLYGWEMHNCDLVPQEKKSHPIRTSQLKYVGCKLERAHVVINALDTLWVVHGTTS